MNKDHYLERSLMSGWEFLTGDIDYTCYGGKWYKQIDDVVYHVIELINWHDATGDTDQPTYNVELQEIDLSIADIESALNCCGWINDETELNHALVVDSVSSYGQYAPMGNWNGNNYRKLLRQAKNESRFIESDHEYHSYMLDRPVNQLGSTACEYARGDFTSALIRGLADNTDPMYRIMGKIQGLSNDDMDQIDESLSDFTLYEDCKK